MMTIQQLTAALDQPDNSAIFADVLTHSTHLLHVQDRDITREFGISSTTLKRWKQGMSPPAPVLRKIVFDYLRTRLPS